MNSADWSERGFGKRRYAGRMARSTAILLGASVLSGCTAMRGAPEPVITASDAVAIANAFQLPGILKTYDSLSEPAKVNYRNEVLAAYLQALDARYYNFRAGLGSGERQSGLAFDIGLLGYAGAATVFRDAAVNLAALSAVASGSRSAVDKNLYFDQAAAALIAAMDAERLKVRTTINQKMAQPAAAYPLVMALGDILEYQNAGTLDHAVTVVTDEAVKQRVAAKRAYDDAIAFACTADQLRGLDEATADRLDGYNFALKAKAQEEAKAVGATRTYRDAMQRSAGILGVSIPDELSTITTESDVLDVHRLTVQKMLRGYCTDEEINSVLAKLNEDATLKTLLP